MPKFHLPRGSSSSKQHLLRHVSHQLYLISLSSNKGLRYIEHGAFLFPMVSVSGARVAHGASFHITNERKEMSAERTILENGIKLGGVWRDYHERSSTLEEENARLIVENTRLVEENMKVTAKHEEMVPFGPSLSCHVLPSHI